MALVFTAVKVTAEKKNMMFLAPGAVRSLEELIHYKPYNDFITEVGKDSSIDTTLAVYQYGEGEKYNATFEELAYFTIRMKNGANFLKDHCKALGTPMLPVVINKYVEK
jgi:hypothetical protein